MKSTVSKVFEDLKFKISEDYEQNWSFSVSALSTCLVLGPQSNRAETGKLQFWSYPFDILNLKSLAINETLGQTRLWS